MNRRSLPHLLAPALILLGRHASAFEATTSSCVAAHEAGQAERNAGRLTRARAELESCAQSACPDLVRRECARLLEEARVEQPTIVISVRDANGLDVDAVVELDGEPWLAHVKGDPAPIDPGEHLLVVKAGKTRVERRVVIRLSEHYRPIDIRLPPERAPADRDVPQAQRPAPQPAPPVPKPSGSVVRTVGWASAGAGVVALAIGGVSGGLAIVKNNAANELCPRAAECSNSEALADNAAARDWATASTIGLVSGGILLVGGALLVVFGSRSTAAQTRSVPSVGAGTFGLSTSW